MNAPIFHVAFPIKDVQKAKEFYINGLDCKAGRETAASLILDLYGHQLVAHVTKHELKPQGSIYPRHFGIIFTSEKDFAALEEKIKDKKIKFYEEPKTRFVGKITEHRSMFIEDPFYNLLEFKFYKHYSAIFGNQEIAEIGDMNAEN
jgi:extradiol dioxygenase family protein